MCNGALTGAVNLSVSGGTSAYSFNWSNAAVTEDISNIAAGVYTVTVSDANSCSTTLSKTITQPAAIAISETHSDVLLQQLRNRFNRYYRKRCAVTYGYLWSNGDNSQDPSGIMAGNYTVTVTDANSCTATSTIAISQPTAFNINLAYNNISCNGGTDGNINITVSGATRAIPIPGTTALLPKI